MSERSVPALTIVHVLSSLGIGGQERVALDLAALQVRAGHRVHVVSLAAAAGGPLVASFAAAGVTAHTVPQRAHLGVRIDPTLPVRLGLLFRRLSAEVVHTHNPLPLIYAALPGRLARAGVIHTKHGRNRSTPGQMWLRRQAARFIDFFVAVSGGTEAQAREQNDCAEEKLLVVPNGIELGRFRPDAADRVAVRAELGIPAPAWVVGTVGRIDRSKNQALLVRAAAPLLAEEARLVIIGDGPLAGEVAEQVRSSPAARFIHLLGSRMDVPRLLPALDVFALSSRNEGLPLVVPEAMACGLPVISTAVGGIPEVIDEGSTGHLVPPADEAALRRRLAGLMSDRPLAASMGRRAREVALSRYSAERMHDDYMRLYARARARAARDA
jgi:glycosyltransferase involved in cell wall biosynthesis